MNQPYNQTVGEKLRQAREQKGISLEDAARATHIRANYLDELENDHPEMFLSAVQARGFLRLYAAFLNLPGNDLADQWENPIPAEIPQAEVELIPEDKAAKPIRETNAEQFNLAEEELSEEGPDQQHTDKPEALPQKIKALVAGIGQKITSIPLIKKTASRVKDTREFGQPEKEKDEALSRSGEDSEVIFKEIGNALRERRQKMDLDLTDVEHFTNLKRMYLDALEEGRIADLPSTVQGRGMLNNYAQFLAMDESAVMDRYVQGLQLQREERLPPQRRQVDPPVSVRVNIPEGVRRILNPDLVVGGAIIIALFGFILWGTSQILGSPEGGEATEAPSISEMLQMTPSVSPTVDTAQNGEGTQVAGEETPVPGVAVVQSTPTIVATVNAAPLQLYIIANDRAYMRISVDGQDVFDGRAVPDNAYTYSGNSQITLLTGNAAALEVYFNQEYLGLLGEIGEVVNLRFAPSGLSSATPQTTATPTPTNIPPAMDEGMMEEEG